jgi:hypothetical protein
MSVQHPGIAATAGHRLPSVAGERLLGVQPGAAAKHKPDLDRGNPGFDC